MTSIGSYVEFLRLAFSFFFNEDSNFSEDHRTFICDCRIYLSVLAICRWLLFCSLFTMILPGHLCVSYLIILDDLVGNAQYIVQASPAEKPKFRFLFFASMLRVFLLMISLGNLV